MGSFPSSSSSMVGQQNNLYTSILAPPPARVARTIMNAHDPPVAAPVRPSPSPFSSPRGHVSGMSSATGGPGNAKVIRSIAEGTRAQAKSRTSKKPGTPDRRSKKASASSAASHHRRQHSGSRRNERVDADGDVDMKAAATLASLLLHHRPSMTSVGSPRSSVASIEGDQQHSQSQQHHQQGIQPQGQQGQYGSFVPRVLTPNPTSSFASTSSSATISNTNNQEQPVFRDPFHHVSPPTTPQHPSNAAGGAGTPRPGPTDNEAADLMLFLATSPSPARKGAAGSGDRDLAAYRALGGGSSGVSRPKGRVLFPSSSNTASSSTVAGDGGEDAGGKGIPTGGSFTSSIGSISGEIDPRAGAPSPLPPTRTSTPVPAPTMHLLPPPSLPLPAIQSPRGYRKIVLNDAPTIPNPHPNSRPSSSQSQSHTRPSSSPSQSRPASHPHLYTHPSSLSQIPQELTVNPTARANSGYTSNEFVNATSDRSGAQEILTTQQREGDARIRENELREARLGEEMQRREVIPQKQQQKERERSEHLGLRADVGRRFFEEEHGGRLGLPPIQGNARSNAEQGQRSEQTQRIERQRSEQREPRNGLGASIDLVKSS